MSNMYNTQLQSNNIDLQAVLETLQTKATGGEQATPDITVNSSTGLITATAGTKSSTMQLTTQSAKTITPSASSQTAVSSGKYTIGDITVTGDSNLVASNIAEGVSIFGVTGTHSAGGTSQEDGLVTRTLTTYSNPRVTSVGSYAFYYYPNLTSIDMPALKSIASQAFYRCHNLVTIKLPNSLTNIGSSAFLGCSKLAITEIPNTVKNISDSAFCACTSLTTITFKGTPTSITSTAFSSCTNLTTINVPWASGAVANAPWGATNATINYNYIDPNS